MIKIKTFSRTISYWNTIDKIRNGMLATDRHYGELVDDIDVEINEFIADKCIVDIKINDVTIHRHNNGSCDTVIRTYTIIYNENL